jgi:isochorismate synthase
LAYPSAFIALLSAPHLGTWITASPELFLGRHQEVLSSYSLAGTRFTAYGKLGEKERIEQQIVTRYIRQVFEKHGMGARVKPTTEHQAGQVAHLLNVVEGLLTKDKDLDLAGLIKGLHPTPAVGGFPKHQAIKFIREFEGYDRGLYTGFMGEFAHQGNFRYYVVLRCARIFHKVLRCFAGAGIVQGSVPSSELAETDAKMDVIRRVLLSRP